MTSGWARNKYRCRNKITLFLRSISFHFIFVFLIWNIFWFNIGFFFNIDLIRFRRPTNALEPKCINVLEKYINNVFIFWIFHNTHTAICNNIQVLFLLGPSIYANTPRTHSRTPLTVEHTLTHIHNRKVTQYYFVKE